MIWDDCQGGISKTFDKFMVPHLRAMFQNRVTCAAHFEIRGWIGIHEYMHSTCVFTTLCLDSSQGECAHGLNGLSQKVMSKIKCMT